MFLNNGRELAVGGDVFHPQRTVLQSRPLDDEALTWADAALILTAHRAMDVERVLAAAPLVVDATRATAGRQAPNLVRLGTPLA